MGVRQGRCTILRLALTVAGILVMVTTRAQSAGDDRPWGLTFRQLEWQDSSTPEAYMHDVQGWVGSRRQRLWFRGEGGKHVSGARYDNRLELLWGHAPRWWRWMDALDLEMLIGVRHDRGTTPSRTYFALGFTGILPLGIRFEGSGYLGDGSTMGDDIHTGVRLQLERGWDLGDRWTLALRGEREIWSEDHVRYSEGIGPWMLSAGLRLHYRIGDHIAPYLGAEWFDLESDTQGLAAIAGEETREVRAVAGLRVQFGRER